MPEPDEATTERFAFYKEHPKNCAPDDFWGQVKRTVHGKPVSEDQIVMIVEAIMDGLNVGASDVLLDLCCGNGALTTRIFDRCAGGLGVDFSPKLIEIAKANFEVEPDRRYVINDVLDHVQTDQEAPRYTKILCYGSFSYLGADRAATLLEACRETYTGATTFFIGNCPDKDQLDAFFTKRIYTPGVEDEPDSAIGIWRTRDEFADLARRTGWSAEFRTMPQEFYAARYRYDVVLTRVDAR